MGFAVFLVYLLLVFLRPAEHFPQLREWAVMDIASGLALGSAGMAVLIGRAPNVKSMQVVLVVVLWTWALLSVVASPLRSESALNVLLGFGKSACTAFLLVALIVNSAGRIRAVSVLLSLLALIVGLQAAIGYQHGFGAAPIYSGANVVKPDPSGFDTPPPELDAPPGTAPGPAAPPPGLVARIRGVGFFGDPNDLAVTLVALLPMCLAIRRVGSPLYNALFVWTPVLLITYSIYLTRSRSGLLALVTVVMLSVRHRLGTTLSAAAGGLALMGFLALGFLGGRTLDIDASARHRLFAWSDGLQMLKASPIWGVGFGMFTQYHPRVAHNSFIHAAAELGLVGYCIWLALVLWSLDDLRFVDQEHTDEAEMHKWAKAVSIGLIGSLVGGLFLSRCYDVLLFIQLGLAAAVVDVARRRGCMSHVRSLYWSIAMVVGFAIVSIIAVWVYMRLQ